MTYDDVCVLLTPFFEEKDKFANTRLIFDETSLTQAFCDIRDIGREEFYLSRGHKYKPSNVITMRKNQYNNAQYLIIGNSLDLTDNILAYLDGKNTLYKVIRSFSPYSNVIPRDRKSYIGSYAPTTNDVELVVEVLKGNPVSDIKKQLINLYQEEIRIRQVEVEGDNGKTYR